MAFDADDGLDMDEVVALAVLNNPELKAKRAQRGIRRAELFNAGLLPDPQLSAGIDHPTGGPGDLMNAYNLGINADIRPLITRGAAQDAARARVRQVDLQVLWQEWQVAEQARKLFVETRAQSQLHQVYQSAVDLHREHYQADRRSMDRGDVSLSVVAGDLASLVNANSRLRSLERARNQTRHRLHQLLGLKPDVTLTFAGTTEVSPVTRDDLQTALSDLDQRRPDLLALKAGYSSQEATVRKEILKQFPTLNVGITRAQDTSGVRTIGLGVSVSLPLFNRNQGGIAVARANRHRLRQAYQSRLDNAASQADQACHEADLLQRQLKQVKSRLPQLQRVVEHAQTALKAGDLDAGTYVSLRGQLLDRRVEAIQLERSLEQSRIALQTLLAMPLATKTPGAPTR